MWNHHKIITIKEILDLGLAHNLTAHQIDLLISIRLLGVSIVTLQGMCSVTVGKSVMMWLGVEIFLILIKIHFLEGLSSRMNAHSIGADHKIVDFQAILITEIFLMT
jgi:xanthine/uracil permease